MVVAATAATTHAVHQRRSPRRRLRGCDHAAITAGMLEREVADISSPRSRPPARMRRRQLSHRVREQPRGSAGARTRNAGRSTAPRTRPVNDRTPRPPPLNRADEQHRFPAAHRLGEAVPESGSTRSPTTRATGEPARITEVRRQWPLSLRNVLPYHVAILSSKVLARQRPYIGMSAPHPN